MASLRRKYQTHFESPAKDGEPPVLSPPQGSEAKLPDPVADAKPPEQIETTSPAEAASSSAIKDRLEEMVRAEGLQQRQQQPQQRPQQPQQQPQQAQEPVDPVEFVLANSGLPERAKAWLRKHPEYVLDQEKNAELQHFHYKARKEAEDFSDGYYGVLERHLGISNGHAETKPTPQPTNHAPRPAAPQRQPAPRMSAPVSAPPTRQAPSMSTGRAPTYRQPLNKEEVEVAQSLGVSLDEYQRNKERWQKMKSEGAQ